MSRLFNGSSQYLEHTSWYVAYPFSISLWFNVANITADHTLWSSAISSGTTNYWELLAAGAQTSDPLRFTSRNTVARNADVNGYAANQWNHAGCYGYSASDRAVYLNGTKGTNTSSSTPTPSRSAIGVLDASTRSKYCNGQIAEFAAWTVQLTDAEFIALAGGVSPLLIRPISLACYMPLWGFTSPEVDLSGQVRHFTLAASPTLGATHAPVGRQFPRFTPLYWPFGSFQSSSPTQAVATATATNPFYSQVSFPTQSIGTATATDPGVAVAQIAQPSASVGSATATDPTITGLYVCTPTEAIASAVGSSVTITGSLTVPADEAIGTSACGSITITGTLTIAATESVAAAACGTATYSGTITVQPAQAEGSGIATDPGYSTGSGAQTTYPSSAVGSGVASAGSIIGSYSTLPSSSTADAVASNPTITGTLTVTVSSAAALAVVLDFSLTGDQTGMPDAAAALASVPNSISTSAFRVYEEVNVRIDDPYSVNVKVLFD